MSKVATVLRTLLGLAFLVFGLNFFFQFLPAPAPAPEAGAFIGALFAGKILTIIKVVEIAAGLALIGNRFVPLALTLLAPIEVGILAFHGVYDPAGLPMVVIIVAITIFLAWTYRAAFAPMLQARVDPTAAATAAAAPRAPSLAARA
jgi:putative oxidoreductase